MVNDYSMYDAKSQYLTMFNTNVVVVLNLLDGDDGHPINVLMIRPDLHEHICTFCINGYNVIVTNGRVTQLLCKRCRSMVSNNVESCPGISDDCAGFRYVDAVGRVAPICSVCHQSRKNRCDQHQLRMRTRRRRRQRH